jgi:hypothetical protein
LRQTKGPAAQAVFDRVYERVVCPLGEFQVFGGLGAFDQIAVQPLQVPAVCSV